jgi:DNA-binding GntR family transcriptional regulator
MLAHSYEHLAYDTKVHETVNHALQMRHMQDTISTVMATTRILRSSYSDYTSNDPRALHAYLIVAIVHMKGICIVMLMCCYCSLQ